MIKINSIEIIIKTDEKDFRIKKSMSNEFNVIYSLKSNTVGKSTLMECIFYALGIEEILGGKNETILKPALKSFLEYEDKLLNVLDSRILLEIENDKGDVITIERYIISQNGIDPRFVKVYSSNINEHLPLKYYLHDGGAATNDLGFHSFFERFLGWKLPMVMKYDEKKSKLYLQTIFSAFFIEQKRGYSDLLSTIPSTYKIISPKQRVIEFILELDIIENRVKKIEYKNQLKELEVRIKVLIKNLKDDLKNNGLDVENFNEYYNGGKSNLILILKNNISLEYYIDQLEDRYAELENIKCEIIKEKVEVLEGKLDERYIELSKNKTSYKILIEEVASSKQSVISLSDELDNIENEISNYIDMKKIKKFENVNNESVFGELCPICNGKMSEGLSNHVNIMNLEENLKFLKSQKSLLSFAKKDLEDEIRIKEKYILNINQEIKIITKDIRFIESQLIKSENSFSEEKIHEKIKITDDLEKMMKIKLNLNNIKCEIKKVNKEIIEKKIELNKLDGELSDMDKSKLKYLHDKFIDNLVEFGYKSNIIHLKDSIKISEYSYFPEYKGFDIKADSSASDNVRVIWAYTLALFQTANFFKTNYPGIIIMDEPRQHNINIEDFKKFIRKMKEISTETQIILAMTINDESDLENINNEELIYIDTKLIK